MLREVTCTRSITQSYEPAFAYSRMADTATLKRSLCASYRPRRQPYAPIGVAPAALRRRLLGSAFGAAHDSMDVIRASFGGSVAFAGTAEGSLPLAATLLAVQRPLNKYLFA
jgi:hypothetical protein